jgi:hypothetical protein
MAMLNNQRVVWIGCLELSGYPIVIIDDIPQDGPEISINGGTP